ncbi:MAG TPA: ATP-binding protein [Candidatus Limnocylindrales bacterium]
MSRSIHIPAEAGHLAEVRAFVRDASTAFGASPLVIDDLVQAADEAVCNVILHGYGGPRANRDANDIEIDVDVVDGSIEIRILDRGPVFDPTSAAGPDLSVPPRERKPGGMGIHLVRAATDAVHHRARPDGGNELRLVRRIHGQEG